MIALLAQAACGPGGTPPAPSSPSPTQGCKTVTIPVQHTTLQAANDPTPGFKLTINTQPVGLIRDNDGHSAWLLGTGLDTVTHVQPSGDATIYQLHTSGLGLQLSQATDGTAWIPERFRDSVVALAPDGTARECTLPGKDREPVATSAAQDGSVWVSEARGSAIAHLVGGRFTEFPIGQAGVKGAEVLADPDGGAWFSVFGAPFLGHVSEHGVVQQIPIGGSGTTLGMLETADKAIWVADFDGDRLVRVAADHSQKVWNAPSGAKPQSLALGPGGVIWVTESGADLLASVRGSALKQEVHTGRWPDHIAITTDGWAWFTEFNDDRLGRVRLAA